MFRKRLLIILILLFIIALSTACIELEVQPVDYRLSHVEELWRPELHNLNGISSDIACNYNISDEYISIGPWYIGDYAAMYMYNKTFEFTNGRLEGYYYTENAEQGQAIVSIQFKDKKGRNLNSVTYKLEAKDEWTQFALPISRSASGSAIFTVSFGNSVKNDAVVFFKDVEVSSNSYKLDLSDVSYELNRPKHEEHIDSQGKWQIKSEDDNWWFVTPHGKPFYSNGIDMPYTEDNNVRNNMHTFNNLFFNTLSKDTDISKIRAFNELRVLPNPVIMNIDNTNIQGDYSRLLSADGIQSKLPDPFDPSWKEALVNRVSELYAKEINKELVIGYYAGNSINHYDLHRMIYSEHCFTVFKDYLTLRYDNNIIALNEAWGSEYLSFDSLFESLDYSGIRTGQQYADLNDFKRVIIDKLAYETMDAVRGVFGDDMPLIFSNMLSIDMVDTMDVINVYGEYYDAIAVNVYNNNYELGLPSWQVGQMDRIHSITNKPIIISEWFVPALDSRLYNNWKVMDSSVYRCMNNQADRAIQARYIATQLYNTPYVIGSHWKSWSDVLTSSAKVNCGLFKSDSRIPYYELHEAFYQLNKGIYIDIYGEIDDRYYEYIVIPVEEDENSDDNEYSDYNDNIDDLVDSLMPDHRP